MKKNNSVLFCVNQKLIVYCSLTYVLTFGWPENSDPGFCLQSLLRVNDFNFEFTKILFSVQFGIGRFGDFLYKVFLAHNKHNNMKERFVVPMNGAEIF